MEQNTSAFKTVKSMYYQNSNFNRLQLKILLLILPVTIPDDEKKLS